MIAIFRKITRKYFFLEADLRRKGRYEKHTQFTDDENTKLTTGIKKILNAAAAMLAVAVL